MIIQLAILPDTVRSIYNGPMPRRMRFLHPSVAASFLSMEKKLGGLVYSDMYRSAEASLAAIQQKSGVKPPAFSGHNYGFSVDIAVDQILREKGWAYDRLLDELAANNWYCHRRDRKRGSEDWHFNCFFKNTAEYLTQAVLTKAKSWAAPVEKLIQDTYGSDFLLDPKQIQTALTVVGMYKGDVDGILGPISTAAIRAFQRAWKLPETSPDERTQRTLAFVSAKIETVPIT